MEIIPHLELDESEVEAFLEKMNMNVGEIQAQVLHQILSRNATTEYLNRYCSFVDDVELDHNLKLQQQVFKEKVPLAEYDDILPYVERIANGDSHHNIVSADPIVELIRSSGTSSGKKKWFPRTTQDQSRIPFFIKLGHNILNRHTNITGDLDGVKKMLLGFMAPAMTTPGGLVVRSAMSSSLRHNMSWIHPAFTSPNEVILCEDVKQSMYSQLLCGLLQRESVVTFGTAFASGRVFASHQFFGATLGRTLFQHQRKAHQ